MLCIGSATLVPLLAAKWTGTVGESALLVAGTEHGLHCPPKCTLKCTLAELVPRKRLVYPGRQAWHNLRACPSYVDVDVRHVHAWRQARRVTPCA